MSADNQGRKTPGRDTAMRKMSFDSGGAPAPGGANSGATPSDGAGEGARKPERQKAKASLCPCCTQSVGVDDVICTNCGYNLKQGTRLETNVTGPGAGYGGGGMAGRRPSSESGVGTAAKAAGKIGAAIGVGFVVACICGAVWGGIAALTGYEFGILAWGIGGVTGIAVAAMTSERSGTVGMAASGLAVFGILIGKILMISWSTGAIADEIMKNPQAAGVYRHMVILKMMDEGSIDEDLVDLYKIELGSVEGKVVDPDTVMRAISAKTEEQQIRLGETEKEIEARIRELTPEQKKEYAQTVIDKYVSHQSYSDLIRQSLSPFDALWFILAVVSAFKIGAGMQEN